jgi:PAS domain S-box-containing protein
MPWIEALSDPRELRRCIRDLVALSTLPALWTRYSPKRIIESLALASLSMLEADFIYIVFHPDREAPAIQVAYVNGAEASLATARAIGRAVMSDCARADGKPDVVPNPVGGGSVRLASASLGVSKAVLVVGSQRTDFPTETQRLLLNTAANQAAMALERWEGQAEERRFISLVERSSDFIAFSDLNGRPQYVNPAGLDLVGLMNHDDLSRIEMADFVVPAESERLRKDCWPAALCDGRWMGELNFRNFKTGSTIPFLVDLFRVDYPRNGHPMNVATVSRDLRKQKQAEFELRRLNESLEQRVQSRTADLVAEVVQRKRADARSQELQVALSHAGRLSTAGEMAATLAHELSQPLSAVTSSSSAAQRLLARAGGEQTNIIREILGEIEEQSLRAGQILHRLRDFVTRGESEKRPEKIEVLIKEASAFAQIGLKTGKVVLEFRIGPRASNVLANRIQIQQVLVNLLRNAFEAMDGMTQPRLTVMTQRLNRLTVEVIVADNGGGLSEEVANNLFEPFVSSRPGGMGLGLAICRSVVDAHGGELSYQANPGGGSIFRFTLPAVAAPRRDHAKQGDDIRR